MAKAAAKRSRFFATYVCHFDGCGEAFGTKTKDDIRNVTRYCSELCEFSAAAAVRRRKGAGFDLYCGNTHCPSRREGKVFRVPADDLPDGELWLCEECRKAPA